MHICFSDKDNYPRSKYIGSICIGFRKSRVIGEVDSFWFSIILWFYDWCLSPWTFVICKNNWRLFSSLIYRFGTVLIRVFRNGGSTEALFWLAATQLSAFSSKITRSSHLLLHYYYIFWYIDGLTLSHQETSSCYKTTSNELLRIHTSKWYSIVNIHLSASTFTF